ncbi:MAG TPA: WD40 repeat domain-containing protein [Bauldia sp.]|nr:WD40 repeat domain-containing protein [Bauldia sp.]
MPSLQSVSFGSFIVEAVFLGDTPAFACGDGTIRVADGNVARTLRAHGGGLLAAAVSEDGRSLLTGGDDGRVVLTSADGKSATVTERPRKWIDLVAVGPSGVIAFAVGREAIVRFPDGRERVLTHDRSVGGLAFAPKGLRLAVARYDGVTLWWAGTEAPAQNLLWKGAHLAVTFSPDGRNVVTSMQENALHGWRLTDGKDMRMSGYPAKPKSMSWSPKGRFLATSGANAAILWPFHFKDGPIGKQPIQLGPREPLVTRVACHPSQELVAIGYQDGSVLIGRIADGNEARLRPASGSPISALGWDRQGKRLALGTEDGTAGIITL